MSTVKEYWLNAIDLTSLHYIFRDEAPILVSANKQKWYFVRVWLPCDRRLSHLHSSSETLVLQLIMDSFYNVIGSLFHEEQPLDNFWVLYPNIHILCKQAFEHFSRICLHQLTIHSHSALRGNGCDEDGSSDWTLGDNLLRDSTAQGMTDQYRTTAYAVNDRTNIFSVIGHYVLVQILFSFTFSMAPQVPKVSVVACTRENFPAPLELTRVPSMSNNIALMVGLLHYVFCIVVNWVIVDNCFFGIRGSKKSRS